VLEPAFEFASAPKPSAPHAASGPSAAASTALAPAAQRSASEPSAGTTRRSFAQPAASAHPAASAAESPSAVPAVPAAGCALAHSSRSSGAESSSADAASADAAESNSRPSPGASAGSAEPAPFPVDDAPACFASPARGPGGALGQPTNGLDAVPDHRARAGACSSLRKRAHLARLRSRRAGLRGPLDRARRPAQPSTGRQHVEQGRDCRVGPV
jgi:hypothetical protein